MNTSKNRIPDYSSANRGHHPKPASVRSSSGIRNVTAATIALSRTSPRAANLRLFANKLSSTWDNRSGSAQSIAGTEAGRRLPIQLLQHDFVFPANFGDFSPRQLLCQKGLLGRIGFSMYILQSVLCSLVFYSYGLGLFGSLELWQTTAVALVIYVLQIGLSTLWPRCYRTGPLEYVWRLLYRGKPRDRASA